MRFDGWPPTMKVSVLLVFIMEMVIPVLPHPPHFSRSEPMRGCEPLPAANPNSDRKCRWTATNLSLIYSITSRFVKDNLHLGILKASSRQRNASSMCFLYVFLRIRIGNYEASQRRAKNPGIIPILVGNNNTFGRLSTTMKAVCEQDRNKESPGVLKHREESPIFPKWFVDPSPSR